MSHYEEFSMFRQRFKLTNKECFDNYINSIEERLRWDVKAFWNFVKGSNKKSGIPSTMRYKDVESDKPDSICKLFTTFFGSVYEQSGCDNVDLETLPINDNCNIMLTDMHISKNMIIKELTSLDVTKGHGPDGLPAFFLKHTANSIADPLLILYNRSLREGVVPTLWKTANIIPVYKSGSRKDISNYRPISLMSTLSKVLERLVHNYIYPPLHQIIIEEQHGFVKNRSTVSNLILYSNSLFLSIDKRIQVDSVYTDFCKAFDKVDHDLLLRNLAFTGIRGTLLRWFSFYVWNRTQRVAINGFNSDDIMKVTSGVAQGSILGPLLFVLFINDINHCFRHTCFLLYADDLKMYREILSLDDCRKLQEDLNRLTNYCRLNKLHLSLAKCKSITFTKKTYNINFTYSLGGTPLEKVSLIRDLGITMDSKLHFDAHINNIVNKAYQLYGFVMRTCKPFKKPATYLLLYKSLIRSQLEYVTSAWNPFYHKYHSQLESVQRKFLRSMNYRCYRSKSPYDVLLHTFSLQTLKMRRLLLDQMLLYKICHHKFDCNKLVNQISIHIPYRCHQRETRKCYLFAPIPCKTNAGERAPLHRLMNQYNNYFTNTEFFAISPGSFRKNILEIIDSDLLDL